MYYITDPIYLPSHKVYDPRESINSMMDLLNLKKVMIKRMMCNKHFYLI
jgi:hypothetical protein